MAVSCFREYMKHQGQAVSRAEFEQNLHEKEKNAAFLNDIKPLLSADVRYDASVAVAVVREVLFEKLAGEPWRGPGAQPSSAKWLKSPRRDR